MSSHSLFDFNPVTIVTDELIVYQGDIQRDDEHRKHSEGGSLPLVGIAGEVDVDAAVDIDPLFIELALACTPVLLVTTSSGILPVLLTNVYPTLGTVQINVNQIIGVSAFNGLVCAASGAAPAPG